MLLFDLQKYKQNVFYIEGIDDSKQCYCDYYRPRAPFTYMD